MPAVAQFDTLRYVEKLISAGVPKSDISDLRSDLTGDIHDLRSELKGDIGELRGDISDLRIELKGDIAAVKLEQADMKSDIKLMKWMLATTVAGVISLVSKTFF